MYNKMPIKARLELVYGYPTRPMTLNVIALEVINETSMGKKILTELGFVDD